MIIYYIGDKKSNHPIIVETRTEKKHLISAAFQNLYKSDTEVSLKASKI